jgi:hypothetical protein
MLLRVLSAYPQGHVTITDHVTGARTEIDVPPGAHAEPESCAANVLAVVSEAKKKLTTSEVLTALEAAGMPWAESTVKGALAQMVRDGTLVNRCNGQGRGYGLPEWA